MASKRLRWSFFTSIIRLKCRLRSAGPRRAFARLLISVRFFLSGGGKLSIFFSNRRKIETTTWDPRKERQSEVTVTSFVLLCVDTASKFSHLRINPLRSCLPLCCWTEDSQWTKEAPQMTYGVGVRSKARAIWIWPQERKFFFTRSEDILYSKEKNIHKSNHNDIFGTFLVKFYCFWRVEQILTVSRCSPHRPPSWFFGWIQNMGEELMPLYSAPSCLNRQNNYFAFSQLTRDN